MRNHFLTDKSGLLGLPATGLHPSTPESVGMFFIASKYVCSSINNSTSTQSAVLTKYPTIVKATPFERDSSMQILWWQASRSQTLPTSVYKQTPSWNSNQLAFDSESGIWTTTLRSFSLENEIRFSTRFPSSISASHSKTRACREFSRICGNVLSLRSITMENIFLPLLITRLIGIMSAVEVREVEIEAFLRRAGSYHRLFGVVWLEMFVSTRAWYWYKNCLDVWTKIQFSIKTWAEF